MVKLRSGDSGSLSVSLIERIVALSEKVYSVHLWFELLKLILFNNLSHFMQEKS